MNASSALVDETIRAMGASEPQGAVAVTERLTAQVWKGSPDQTDLAGMWGAFMNLLRRRGYYVSTASELAGTLGEIHALGEGFDLYDLARALAELDRALADGFHLKPDRQLPDLKRFSRRNLCGGSSAEKNSSL